MGDPYDIGRRRVSTAKTQSRKVAKSQRKIAWRLVRLGDFALKTREIEDFIPARDAEQLHQRGESASQHACCGETARSGRIPDRGRSHRRGRRVNSHLKSHPI